MAELRSEELALELIQRFDSGTAQLLRLAGALRRLDDLEGALEHLENARRLIGDEAMVDSCLGVVLTFQGQLEAALEAHRRALRSVPDGGTTPLGVVLIWNAAHTLLAAGQLDDGWNAYEARRLLGLGPAARVTLPEWGVAGADSGSVLVLAEQGVGDEVLFGSCLPDLVAEAERIYLECDRRLVSLLARSFPTASVGPEGSWSGPRATVSPNGGPYTHIPIGSLPRRYRPSLGDFPTRGVYLEADPQRMGAWRARLAGLPGGARIGISWRSILTGAGRRREYARLRAWAPILQLTGMQFVNLQYGDCERELADVEHELGITIHRWDDVDLRDDLEEVAALITALDAVVAPRNAVAHIAGALGTRTLMLANPHAWSDLGTGTLPWFPAVTPLYRSPDGGWDDPITAAAELLGHAVA